MAEEAPQIAFLSPIAKPLANDKLNKKVLKTVKKATKVKNVRRGVKEVVKAIRKGEKGLCVLAGDVTPLDVISHIPVLCEEMSVPYVYVSSKSELGKAASTLRNTSCILVYAKGEAEHKEALDECLTKVQSLSS
eukprot:TRINITY_DN183_c0_g1_i1.p1 TRINITY_DN183_c0_g1~~TRINITY_DN183_c0_g1_i1.p1  ORF type:complete len:151 (+),score=91.85 TRINITY_DN183_c0_g1_i1:53-454(+)